MTPGRTFTEEESRRIVAELSILARLAQNKATIEETLFIWELIPKILTMVRAGVTEGRVKFALFTVEELQHLIAGLDALRSAHDRPAGMRVCSQIQRRGRPPSQASRRAERRKAEWTCTNLWKNSASSVRS